MRLRAFKRAGVEERRSCKSAAMVSMLQWHFIVGMLFLILKGCMSALTGPKALSGFLGRSLSVMCKYDDGYQTYKKYWCKGSSWKVCKMVVHTVGTEEERTVGRMSIKDNHSRLEFTVRLENLTRQDAGIYWCGLERIGSDFGHHVNITVLPGLFSGLPIISNSTVSGPLGGSLSVICRYSEAYKSYLKYWCKDGLGYCRKIIETTKSSSLVKRDSFSINDNQRLYMFTVITENLTLQDTGQYRCGINIPFGSDDYFPVTVMVIQVPLTTTTAAAAVTTRGPDSDSEPPGFFITILLPVIFLVLMVLLVAALLLMRSLKKQKDAKAGRDILLSMAPNLAEGNNPRRTEKPKQRPHHKAAPPSSHQATNHTEEVEYATVMETSTSASQPQVPTDTEQVSYASLSFQSPVEEATYANV